MKLKRCTSANSKHTWSFIRNVTRTQVGFSPSGSRASMSLVGIYSCATCRSKKTGDWQPADQPSLV